MRMTRTMMLEVLRQDYVRTAWAKGLRERLVILRHVVKNALIPVVTLVGLQVPIIVGGAVIMEQMFAIPGLGRLMIDALFDRDYPIISGINLFFAVAVMVINLLVDVLYAYLDPRVHYGRDRAAAVPGMRSRHCRSVIRKTMKPTHGDRPPARIFGSGTVTP
jgi:peptide/nickel transport system permease protein